MSVTGAGISTVTSGTVGATGFEQARQLVQNVTKNDITNLYRSVGAEEYLDIQKTGMFNLFKNTLEAKQFGLNAAETLKFANWDRSSVAVIGVQIQTEILNKIGNFTQVDVGIFKSGNVTIDRSSLDIFNKAIISIFEKY